MGRHLFESKIRHPDDQVLAARFRTNRPLEREGTAETRERPHQSGSHLVLDRPVRRLARYAWRISNRGFVGPEGVRHDGRSDPAVAWGTGFTSFHLPGLPQLGAFGCSGPAQSDSSWVHPTPNADQ